MIRNDLATIFLATTPDGVMVATRSGSIIYWNAGCERIFGFAAEEACSCSLDHHYPGEPEGAPLGRVAEHHAQRAVPRC